MTTSVRYVSHGLRPLADLVGTHEAKIKQDSPVWSHGLVDWAYCDSLPHCNGSGVPVPPVQAYACSPPRHRLAHAYAKPTQQPCVPQPSSMTRRVATDSLSHSITAMQETALAKLLRSESLAAVLRWHEQGQKRPTVRGSGFLSRTRPSAVMGKLYQLLLVNQGTLCNSSRRLCCSPCAWVSCALPPCVLAVVLTATREAEARILRGILPVSFLLLLLSVSHTHTPTLSLSLSLCLLLSAIECQTSL